MEQVHAHKKLVLASSSPRRIQMFNDLGIEFESVTSPFAEPDHNTTPCPEKTVMDNAGGKAHAVAAMFDNAFIIGCDTVVAIDNTILGKPATPDAAFTYLNMLNGRTHAVYTGICVIDSFNKTHSAAFEKTLVTMRHLNKEEITAYLSAINPMDKAGAYAIQGAGALIVRGITGCYYNVVGFPLAKLEEMLLERGGSLFAYIRNR